MDICSYFAEISEDNTEEILIREAWLQKHSATVGAQELKMAPKDFYSIISEAFLSTRQSLAKTFSGPTENFDNDRFFNQLREENKWKEQVENRHKLSIKKIIQNQEKAEVQQPTNKKYKRSIEF